MNRVYPEFSVRQSPLGAGFAGPITWRLQPVDPTAFFDPFNTVLGDLGPVLVGAGDTIPLDAVSNDGTAARYETSGTVTLIDVTSADDVGAFVVVADDGVDEVLVAWIDTRADSSPVAFVGTGAPVPVEFPLAWFLRV